MEKLKARAQALNEAIEHLTDLLADAETSIVGLKLGVSASVPLDDVHKLTFARIGVWGLFVLGPSTKVPLVNVSKDLRVLAAGKLQALIAALVTEAERQLVQVQEATATCEAILAAFKAA